MTMSRAFDYLLEVNKTAATIRPGKAIAFGGFATILLLICSSVALGERFWPTAFLLDYGLWICGGIAALGIIAAAASRYYLGILVSASGFGFAYLFWSFPALFPPGGAPTGPTLKVMSFNVEENRMEKGVGHLLNLTIEKANPDILLMQECSLIEDDPVFRMTFSGYNILLTQSVGIAYNPKKIKLVQMRQLDFLDTVPRESTNRFGQILVLEWEDKRFNVVNLQLRNDRLRTGFNPKLKAYPEASWQDKAFDSASIYKERYAMFMELVKELKDLPGPVLLTGDFGFTPNGILYPEITSRFADTFSEAGGGTGITSSRGRTSYVFASKHWKPIRSYTLETAASSHKPIVAEVQLMKDESGLVRLEKDPDNDQIVSDPDTAAYEERLAKEDKAKKVQESKEKSDITKPKPSNAQPKGGPAKASKPKAARSKVEKVTFRRSAWAPMYGRDVVRQIKTSQ